MKKRFLALTLAALLAVETGVMGNAINVNAGSMDDKGNISQDSGEEVVKEKILECQTQLFCLYCWRAAGADAVQ